MKKLDLKDIDSHPIAAKFYMAMLALEKLPASKDQTAAVQALQDCRLTVEREWNGSRQPHEW